MALTPAQKQDILKKYGKTEKDCGSASVQIAMLTERLKYLNGHFKKHKGDHHSRTGLMKMVGRRRHLLDYLKRKDTEQYKKLIADLGIRK